ncbi:hypothetical protein JCM16303_001920 [Sporobolomyces ruberrimus]
MRPTTSYLFLTAVLIRRGFAQRTIVVENRCDYPVWPAISAFPDNPEPYTGEPGWEAEPGKKHSVTVPSSWSGRIWGRRGCMTDPKGLLVCVAGGCANGLDCGESVLGESTALELRLKSSTNGQYDVFDLMNGGGWSIPTRVKPQAKTCSSVECIPDLDGCPLEEMKLKDSYGVVLGCSSTCFAHVGDQNVQCCIGEFGDPAICTPDKISYYDYFKTPCKNSYAYFASFIFAQHAEGEPGFTLTFCPDGDSGKSNSTATSDSGSTKSTATQSDGEPTGTGQALPSNIPALTSAMSVEGPTSANSTGSASESAGSSIASSTTSAASASSSASSTSEDEETTAESSESTSESTSATDGEILGLKTPVFAGVVGGILVVGILAVVIVCVCIRKRSPDQARGRAGPYEGGPGNAASRSEMESANTAPSMGHRRRSSGRRALLEERASSSEFSTSEDEEPIPVSRRGSARSSRSSRRG